MLRVLSSVWKVAPQTCRRPCSDRLREILHEAGDQVGLGEQRIDREVDLQPLVQFEQPRADGVGVGLDLRRRQRHQVFEADRDHDAVDRLARPVLLEQVEEGEPALLVGLGVGILGGVAAGGVDQHRVFGEPPVAVARAADAGDRRRRCAARQREFQAGIDQRGGLAGAGRADQQYQGRS